jgi:hypothetical protein
VAGLASRELVACLPFLPADVIVNAPALARGALPRRPGSRVRAEGFPVLRQIQSLPFQRMPLPVALQACVCAHFRHPIRDDNALPERDLRERAEIDGPPGFARRAL